MKYNNDWVIRSGRKDFLFFWGNDPDKPYSQWYPSPFQQGGNVFHTAEHWMMYHKAITFHDVEAAQTILGNSDPAFAKRQGRLLKEYNDDIWNKIKYHIVRQGNVLKFSLPQFKPILLATGEQILVEASPFDKVWGIGLGVEDEDCANPENWKGENLLGYAIMEARDIIKLTDERNREILQQDEGKG